MARSDKRISVYPSPRAVALAGGTAPALNLAIECWAAQVARATADNSKLINSDDEWAVLIRAFAGAKFEPDFPNPGDLLATAVQEASRVYGVHDDLHYEDGEEPQPLAERVAGRLRTLDYPHAWAVILTVRW